MNQEKLLKYAINYLSKYDSSKKNLAYILKRKIFKIKSTDIEKNSLKLSVNNILEILEKNNLLNDERYCLSRIGSFSRFGKSKNYITNYLLKKGIDKEKINKNFKVFENENNNWELKSAKLFAKKKRLQENKDDYEKKLAKMARAGFSYEICKKILG